MRVTAETNSFKFDIEQLKVADIAEPQYCSITQQVQQGEISFAHFCPSFQCDLVVCVGGLEARCLPLDEMYAASHEQRGAWLYGLGSSEDTAGTQCKTRHATNQRDCNAGVT